MSNWRTRLREADRDAGAELRQADVDRLRSTVLAAARQSAATPRAAFSRTFVLTAAVLVMVCAGMLTGLQSVTRQVDDDAPVTEAEVMHGADDAPDLTVERQQLQFSTPGGTRIIWVFDSHFDVKGTLP